MIWSPTGAQALSKASTADGLILAGDADGGFVIPAVGRSADAMAALVVLLGLVARTRLTLRQIDTRIPSTTLLRDQIPMPWARKASVMRAVREAAGDLPIDETEGLRIMFQDRAWVLITPDPSAAAIRIWAESPREHEAHELLSTWTQVVLAAQDDDADAAIPVE
jgi:mannose-1-phosphate guanylyltransferase/phosphomannomutase